MLAAVSCGDCILRKLEKVLRSTFWLQPHSTFCPVTYSVSGTPAGTLGIFVVVVFRPLCDFLGWVIGSWNALFYPYIFITVSELGTWGRKG